MCDTVPRRMSSTRLLSLVVGVGLAGCSVIYDADDLRNKPDAIPLDADPSMLALDSVDPPELLEGVGDDGGRPALLLINGESIVDSAEVTVELLDEAGTSIAALEHDGFIADRDR